MFNGMRRFTGGIAFIALFVALFAMPVAAAGSSYSLFGDATVVSPGHNSPNAVQLNSNIHAGAGYGGIDFAVPAGTTFANIQNLATDYMFTQNSCGGGSPRFQINVDGKNAFVYIGPPPNYTNCPMNVWVSTGNLATPASFVDTSQLPGGNQYDTFAHADTLYGNDTVTGIQLVADAGWFFSSGLQTVQVDNVMINGQTYTFDPPTQANQCKDGGWQNFNGMFKNQGDCVSFVATKGKNPGNG